MFRKGLQVIAIAAASVAAAALASPAPPRLGSLAYVSENVMHADGTMSGNTSMTLLQFDVEVDGDTLKDVRGHSNNGTVAGHSVAKRRTWGAEPSPEPCNGEWEFQPNAIDDINGDADLAACSRHDVTRAPGSELSSDHRIREIE